MLFSERYGYRPVREVLQVETMDDDLRIALWNVLDRVAWQNLDPIYTPRLGPMGRTLQAVWSRFMHRAVDEIPEMSAEVRMGIRHLYFNDFEWHDVYSFIEFLVHENETLDAWELVESVNTELEKHLAAYRVVDALVVPVTAEEEIEAIERAAGDSAPFAGVRRHLASALAFLGDREDPHYADSVKESISAVEGMAQLIVGSDKATLGDALKQLREHHVRIHPCLNQAFEKLYGYTSDADGVRHGSFRPSEIGVAEARFMLVACSAFVSYLIEKATEAGIDLSRGMEAGSEA